MRSPFIRRARSALVFSLCCSLTPAWAVDPSQQPRDDSTGPGSAVGNSQAPWKSDVESVRQQIPVSIANARTETLTYSCGGGYAGVRFQTRLVKTFTNGVVQADPWSAVQGECVGLPSAVRGTVLYVVFGNPDSAGYNGQYRICPIGFTGDPSRSASGCFWNKGCPSGYLTPTAYGSYESGSGESTGSGPSPYVSNALCIQP